MCDLFGGVIKLRARIIEESGMKLANNRIQCF